MSYGPLRRGSAVLACLVILACGAPRSVPPVLLDADQVRAVLGLWPRPDPPTDETNAVEGDPRAAHLGRFLFFDTGLSRNGQLSCASCHDPARAFTDGRATALGLSAGTRNSPTVLDVSHNRWFFWDGRADSAWSQALGPLEAAHEMGADRLAIVHRLARDPELAGAYGSVFGALPAVDDGGRFPAHARPVPDDTEHPHHRAWLAMDPGDRRAANRVFANVGKAIAAYERLLAPRGSRFDRFAAGLAGDRQGDLAALTAAEQRGLALFVGRGRCLTCHAGPLLTDGEFHATGAPSAEGLVDSGRWAGSAAVLTQPFGAASAFSDDTTGPRAQSLATLRRDPTSWGEFKTPSLRNVADTAPYMHAGQLTDLYAVVRFYATLEGALVFGHHGESVLTPFALSDSEADDLVAFLQSLTDRPLPTQLLEPPDSPALD